MKGKVLTVFELPSLGVFIEDKGFSIPVENVSHLYKVGDVIEVEGKLLFSSSNSLPIIISMGDTYLAHTELNLTYPTKRITEVNRSEVGRIIKISGVFIQDVEKNWIGNYTHVVFNGSDGVCYKECEDLEIGSNYDIVGALMFPSLLRIFLVYKSVEI
jgi:hypothetical protein